MRTLSPITDRTDTWVAHQLEVSVQDIEQFKRQNELVGDEDAAGSAGATDYEEIDLRAEDDALIAAELDAPRRRGRSRRGGRGRRPARPNAGPLEGTFDHGEEGYGLWLDPAVQDNPIYAEHWAGHRPVEVLVEEDRIVIRRTGSDSDD